MIGVQDQTHIEDARLTLVGHLAFEHVEKIGGNVEFRFGRDEFLSFTQTLDGGDDDRKLRGQACRRAQRACA